MILGQTFQRLPNEQNRNKSLYSNMIKIYISRGNQNFVFHYIPIKSSKRTKSDDGLPSCVTLMLIGKHLLSVLAIVLHNMEFPYPMGRLN